MFQFRRFPSYTYWFSIWCMSFTHADCSIRKSADQFMLADTRSFSQLTTSFIGSQCQGILPALLLAWPFWIMSNPGFCNNCSSFRFLWMLPTDKRLIYLLFVVFPHLHYFYSYSIFKVPGTPTALAYSNKFRSSAKRLRAASRHRKTWVTASHFHECCTGHKWTRTIDLTLIRRAL